MFRLAIGFLLVVCSSATYADTLSSKTILDAQVTVAKYRQLRKECTNTFGDARISCFKALGDMTEGYQAAKQILEQVEATQADRSYISLR